MVAALVLSRRVECARTGMSTGAGRWEPQPDASAAAWLQGLDPVDASPEELQLRRRLRELDEQEQQAGSEAQRRSARAEASDIHSEILPRFGVRVSELMPDLFAAYGRCCTRSIWTNASPMA